MELTSDILSVFKAVHAPAYLGYVIDTETADNRIERILGEVEIGNPLNAVGIHIEILKRRLTKAVGETAKDLEAPIETIRESLPPELIAGGDWGDFDKIVASLLREPEGLGGGHYAQLAPLLVHDPHLRDTDHLVYSQVSAQA